MKSVGKQLAALLAGAVFVLAAREAGAAEPVAESPVQAFRKLLSMPSAEQQAYLSKYSPATRQRIEAKLQEYEIMPPDVRELRLRVTELRWYLLPLMQDSPTNRAAKLAAVPDTYRGLVAARLDEWDLMPPTLKDEVLKYESTISRFIGRNAGGKIVLQPRTDIRTLPDPERREQEAKLASWQSLSEPEREQMYASFEHVLELGPAEKQKTLDALSPPQRVEAEKVVTPIEKWPRSQQLQYLAAFRQFAKMTPAERDQFMKNARRWQQMSPAERQAWRDLAQQLAEMPPLPADVPPPSLKPAGPTAVPAAGTNGNPPTTK
jgi:hypothetical protein